MAARSSDPLSPTDTAPTDAGRETASDLATARAARFHRLLDAIPSAQRPAVIDALSLLIDAAHDRVTIPG